MATQGVPGEGPRTAPLMLVGEAPGDDDVHVMVTIHPSSLLRISEETQRRSEFWRFVKELKAGHDWLRKQAHAH